MEIIKMSISIKDAMIKVAFRKDGEDHILISPFAGSQLGKYASMSWRKKFFFPMLGEFVSPMAFMAWLATGDEMQRHANNPTRLPSMAKDEYLRFLRAGYLAKWYQLTSMHGALVKHIKAAGEHDPFGLPWVEYKIHVNGLKEFPQSQLNAEVLKKLLRHNFIEGNKDGLKSLNSDIIPNFELEDVQSWIDETVRKKFNLTVPVETDQPEEEVEVAQPQQAVVVGEEDLAEAATA